MVNAVCTEQLHNSKLRRTPEADTINRGRGVRRREGVPNKIPQDRAPEVVRKRIISADTAKDTPEPDLLVIAVARGPGISHRLETAHRDIRTRFEDGEKLIDAAIGDRKLRKFRGPLTDSDRKRLGVESPSDDGSHSSLKPTREEQQGGQGVKQAGEGSGKGPLHDGSVRGPRGGVGKRKRKGDGVPHRRPPQAGERPSHGEVLQGLALKHAAKIKPQGDSDLCRAEPRRKRKSSEAGKAATPCFTKAERPWAPIALKGIWRTRCKA